MIISGVSYAGNPLDNTAMFISKKVEALIENLYKVHNCKVFLENGISVPEDLKDMHEFVFSNSPQRDYALFISQLAKERDEKNRNRKYTEINGSLIGENVYLGEGTIVEPGAFIDHDVVIGKYGLIKTGAKIRHTIAGDYFIACENCTIGTSGFTMAEDENGNKIRIATLGKIIIGDNVEIGSLTNVSCGSAGNTVLGDNVKLDTLVHIGHDACLKKNVEIPAGAIIGGFDILEEGAYVGINATLRNRITIGKNALVGMAAVVTKSVDEGVTVVGNPAKPLVKEAK